MLLSFPDRKKSTAEIQIKLISWIKVRMLAYWPSWKRDSQAVSYDVAER